MKYIKILLLAAAASLAFACGKQDYPAFEFGPQDDTTGKVEVYFPITSANLEIEPTDSSIVIPLARTETTGALSVPLVVGNPTGLFVVPATAEFEDGAATTTIEIGLLKLEMEIPYVLSITVGGDYRYMYKQSSAEAKNCSFHFEVLKQKWDDVGTATFYDLDFWGDGITSKDGLLIQNHSGTADYRIVSPYSTLFPDDFDGDTPHLLFVVGKDEDGYNVVDFPDAEQDIWPGTGITFYWDSKSLGKYQKITNQYENGEHTFKVDFVYAYNHEPWAFGQLAFTWHDCPVEFPIPTTEEAGSGE